MADLMARIGGRQNATVFNPQKASYNRPQFGTSNAGPSEFSLLERISPSNMAVADSRHSSLCGFTALGKEDPDTHSSLAPTSPFTPVDAELPFAASRSRGSVGIDGRHTETTVSRNDGFSHNGIFSATHATEQTRKHTTQSSDAPSINNINRLLSKGVLEDLLRSLKALKLPQLTGSNQPQSSSMPPEQLRDTLLPVILKNAQRRPEFNDKLVTKVEVGLREALTDQFCDSLSQKLSAVNRVQATRGSKATATVPTINHTANLATVAPTDDQNVSIATTTSPSSVREPPKAPRAMRSESSARLSSQGSIDSSVFQPRSDAHTLPLDSGRVVRRPTAHEFLEGRSRWDRPLREHESNGIPIPLDPLFFPTPPVRTIQIKRESPGPTKDGSFLTSHSRRSRSPRRRSPSPSSRRSPSQSSRHDTTHRSCSFHELSTHRRLSRSPRRLSRDHRRSRSHSRPRKGRSPPPKPRRPSFSWSRSPPRLSGSYRSGSRPRENSFSLRQRSSTVYRRRSRSPYTRKASFQIDRKTSFRHRSPEPLVEPRRTPVHMRSIDRTRPSPPPNRRDSISDRPGLPIRRVLRSPEPLSAVSNQSRRLPSPSRRKHSPSRDSANYQRSQLPSSLSRTHSPVLLPRRLSPVAPRAPDSHRNNPVKDGLISTSVSNYERTQPPTPASMPIVKRELDVEDSTSALHPSPPPATSPVDIASPSKPGSPRTDHVTPTNILPASPSAASVASMPPPSLPSTHVSPAPQSPIDSGSVVQKPGHGLNIPPSFLPKQEESDLDQNRLPVDVENRAHIPLSSVPSFAQTHHAPSEVLPPHRSSQQLVPDVSSSPPLDDSSMATQSCFTVPGLWFAKHGHGQADIMDCEFEVNSAMAQRWNLLGSSNATEVTSERLSLRLLCIPVELLQSIYQIGSVPGCVDLGALTSLKTSVKTVWPEQGSLLVQMNPTKPHKMSWFPEHMGPTSPGLDITDFVREGKNILRLIQLEDMANKIFILQASLLPPTLQQNHTAYWDVADFNLVDHLATWNLLPATVEDI